MHINRCSLVARAQAGFAGPLVVVIVVVAAVPPSMEWGPRIRGIWTSPPGVHLNSERRIAPSPKSNSLSFSSRPLMLLPFPPPAQDLSAPGGFARVGWLAWLVGLLSLSPQWAHPKHDHQQTGLDHLSLGLQGWGPCCPPRRRLLLPPPVGRFFYCFGLPR